MMMVKCLSATFVKTFLSLKCLRRFTLIASTAQLKYTCSSTRLGRVKMKILQHDKANNFILLSNTL